MLPPSVVTPALSKALRYSTITDFLCSSVIVCLETAIDFSLRLRRRCAPRRQLLCAFLAFLVGRRRCQIRESQNRSDRGTAGPIGPRRRRGDAIADPIEAGNGLVLIVDDLAADVGLRATLGVEIPAGQKRGVVGTLVGEGEQGGIGRRRRRRHRAVEQELDLALAALEVEIPAAGREAVEALDRRRQRFFKVGSK